MAAKTPDPVQVRNRILLTLYERAFSPQFDNYELDELASQEGWDSIFFENLVNRMSAEGLIEAESFGWHYAIRGYGVLAAEQAGIIPQEMLNLNSNARTLIMIALGKVYEDQGDLSICLNSDLVAQSGLGETLTMANLNVLVELGYVEYYGNAGCKITHGGLDALANYQKKLALAEDFERVSAMEPRPRGRTLQKILARVIVEHGWNEDEGVKTSNEEMDLIIFRDREFYLLESKWEKDPIEAECIREVFGKLGNRIDVRGIVLSMSGFSKGAVQQAHDYIGQKIILLFGEQDVKDLVYQKISFDQMLNEKYKALVTTRRVEFS